MDLIAARQRIRNYAAESGKNWYKISNASGAGPTRISIYGEIGFYGVSAQDMCDQLDGIDGPIEIFVNSPGGEIFEGLAIYNYLLRRGPSVFVDGIAASAASFIVQAAAPGKLGMAKTSRMMIHNGQALAAGDAKELREMADLLEKETKNIATIYSDRSGKPAEYWLDMMDKTSWLDAPEAVGCGLADFMYDPRVGPTAVLAISNVAWQFDLSDYVMVKPGCEHNDMHKGVCGRVAEVNGNALGIQFDGSDDIHHWYADNELLLVSEQNQSANGGPPPMAPGRPSMRLRNAATVPYVGRSETRHVPTTATHTHDHGAHGHSDHDDGIHSHVHSHVNDSSHDHVHTHHDSDNDDDDDTLPSGDYDRDYFNHYTPGMSYEVHIDNANFDGTAWSGGAAMKAASNSPSPGKAFAAICAGRRDGPADERASWALPHHKHPGSPPNRNGVNNALARLSGTQGLTNKDAARAHLEAHQKAWASESNSADGYTEDDARSFANFLKGV